MSSKHAQHHHGSVSPLDRLIHLLAEIEVAAYLTELGATTKHGEEPDESRDLRPLQRGQAT